MTLEQQIKDLIEAAGRQLSGQFSERLQGIATEIGQAASAERVSVVRELRVAAEAESAKRSQEAVAAAQAEHAQRLEEAVNAAHQEGARRIDEAVAAAQAEYAQRLEEAVNTAHKEGARKIDEAVAAARVEQARKHDEDLAAAQAEHAQRLEEAVAAAHQEGARRIDDAVAAAQAELNREHQSALVSVRSDVAREIEDAVAAARSETASQHDAVTASIRADAARSQADAVASALAEAEQQLVRARDEAEQQLVRARDEAEQQLARTRDEAEQQLARARDEAEQQLAGSIDAARREVHETAERTLVETRASERHAELAQMERLVEAVRRLDTARSLTDALDVLVDVASKEAPRVAVFMARGTRVLGWKGAGLPPGTDLKQMDMSAAESGLIPRAMRAAAALTTSESADPALMTTPFGVLPTDAAGLAVALRVGGEPVAVLYADDAADHRREVPSAWPEAVELLARHAARCLEVLTVVRVSRPIAAAPAMAAASAPPTSPRFAPQARAHAAISDTDDDAGRRYAKLLVSEIKLYHESAVSQGRRDANILQRLREEINRARTLYDERVPHAVRSRADYFEQELVRTLANGDRRLLGQMGGPRSC